MKKSEKACTLPDRNPSIKKIRDLLDRTKTIAIVGLSNNPERESYEVGTYLKKHGYRIIPVNPNAGEILGEKCYPDLASVPEPVDVVDIFRTVDAIPGIVGEAVSAGAKAVWMQLGLSHHDAAARARCAGLVVVQSRCMKQEHMRYHGIKDSSTRGKREDKT